MVKQGEMNLGTSIMAITYDGGVVLGADSRTSMGAFVANRVTDKLTHIHNKIWCCRSGSAADTQTLAEYVRLYLDQYENQFERKPSTKVAASLFRELASNNRQHISAGVIVVGYDDDQGPQVYSVPLGGSLHKQEYAIAGSGSTYIYGLCNEKWEPGMSREKAIEFVKTALAQAIRWDGSSGGVIRIAVLSKDETERLLFLPNEYQR